MTANPRAMRAGGIKDQLMKLLKLRQKLPIRRIYSELQIKPADESDRVKVWRVGQALAELVILGFLEAALVNGQRWYFSKEIL